LVAGLLGQKRIVYLCTNGLLMRRKLLACLTSDHRPGKEALLRQLQSEGLVTPDMVADARNGRRDQGPVIQPTQWFYWNVHLDGLERTHDRIVGRDGVFRECVAAIRLAKRLGFQVAVNTTVYKESEPDEIEDLFRFCSWLGVDGFTISPGYEYDAAKAEMIRRGGRRPEDFFLTREMTRRKFARVQEWGRRYTLFGTVVYQEFLMGLRELTCSAWAIPTRNIKGWKAPCYLITDGHYATYQEMLAQVNWDKYGVVNGVVRDPRCRDCMVHCGFDPSGALGVDARPGDTWKNIKYNFGPRPKPCAEGERIQAYHDVPRNAGQLTAILAAKTTGFGTKTHPSHNDELVIKVESTNV